MFNKDEALAAVADRAKEFLAALESLEVAQKTEAPARESATLNPLGFSQATGFGLTRVRGLLHAGKIKHVKSGRRVLIPRSEVDAFLERESTGGQK